MKDLQLYSIMRLDEEHLEEICQDIREQIERGIATCPLFCMTLVPEDDPPVDKVSAFCAVYRKFHERLKEMGLPSGVLVQASIGHGWVLSKPFGFQAYTAFDSGETRHTVCPMDEGFRAYIRRVFRIIAACQPDTIMLDDDFRLMARSGGACGCPLHIAEFNRRAGTDFTREQLWSAVHENSQLRQHWEEIFVGTQRDALLECAREMRAGIDEIDPSLPGSYCCVGNNVEFAAEIAEIMAGTGNPVVVRINNGYYTPPGLRNFSEVFYRAAQQVAKLKGKADVILAETDTCPQNRYSTGAMSLHTHFTGTILEGAAGAKHWITRLLSFEPESGKAFRRILGRYAGFYRTLAELVPTLRWRGCRIPVTDRPYYGFRSDPCYYSAWGRCVLERMGLPMYFSAEPGGILCLEGSLDKLYTDEQMAELLSGPVFLASDTASRLIDRGFGEDLGVDVRPWDGPQPSFERLPFRNNSTKIQVRGKQLIPLSEEVAEASTVFHGVDGEQPIRLFPGSTIFRNLRGGTAFVFSGTPAAAFNLVEAFSFLNYSRKRQLIDMMRKAGELPVWYDGDEDTYFRAADTADGKLFCAVFNLSTDMMEEIRLGTDRPVRSIKRLAPSGEWREVSFTVDGEGILCLDECCPTLDAAVFLLE